MKILVIQLLRLGDIVTSAPVAKALKDVHPDSKIHFLINSQFSSVKPLIPYVDQFIGFNRSKLQRKIVSKDVSFFAAFRGFKSLVEHLKNEKYDLVINLTQNRLSGYLVGILNPTQSLGLQLNGKSSVKFGATQFQFLNWHGLSKDISTPHYIDIYLDALKTQSVQRKIILKETRSGFEEAKKIVQNQDIDLLIQPLTSDKKKNWGLDKFKVFIENYLKMNPSHRIGILGAPPEKKQLQNFVGDLNSDQIFLCITSLEGALSLIKKSKV